jgi:hypothetical protein
MSTKTLRKRIALVAVSAMGIGLLSSVVPANAAGTSTITVTSIARAGVGATIKIVSDTTTITTSEFAHWSLVSAPTTPTAGTLATGAGALVAASTGSYYTANITADGSNILVAGTYNILVWVNTNTGTSGSGGAYPAVGDVATTHSITVAGAPTSATVTSPTGSVAAGTANGLFTAVLKDANGANTVLSGNETLTVKAVQGTSVPAAGVVAEAMVALVLAEVVLEKFGGDSVTETRRNFESYITNLNFK